MTNRDDVQDEVGGAHSDKALDAPPKPFDGRYQLVPVGPHVRQESFGEAVAKGLQATAKTLPCRFLYDERGSVLFEAITDLDEYYPTRCERSILQERAREIARAAGAGVDLVELGSGSALKTRLIIDALLEEQAKLRFVPIDISKSMLDASSRDLLRDYEDLEVRALEGEYEAGLRDLDKHTESPCRLLLWLGSSIGNLSREEAAHFLGSVRASMRPRDRLLLGIDLRKDAQVLERAYDDAEGVTAAFNLNLLTRINEELGADFDLAQFQHRSHYRETEGRVEMHLVSDAKQVASIDEIDCEIAFEEGEIIHTENAYKYSLEEIDELARETRMQVATRWLDSDERFSVNLLASV